MESHTANLGHIVGTLGYDLGVLFAQEGERMVLVDGAGKPLAGNALLGVMASLVAETTPGARLVLSTLAPDALVGLLEGIGANVVRTRSDVRSILESGFKDDAAMAADEHGGFAFPAFHPGFDAAFAFARLLTMLASAQAGLRDRVAALPPFHLARELVGVDWEARGALMRRLAERAGGGAIETPDGLKVRAGDGWVLVRPDALEPQVHVHAEAANAREARSLAGLWAEVVREFAH